MLYKYLVNDMVKISQFDLRIIGWTLPKLLW